MRKKLILMNGPKGIGKDSALAHLEFSRGLSLTYLECKDHLHELTQLLFGVDKEIYESIYFDRELKEKPHEAFRIATSEVHKLIPWFPALSDTLTSGFYDLDEDFYLSVREAMIYVSEVVCKPAFGKQYFGEMRAKAIREFTSDSPSTSEIIVDGSCGFTEELEPLKKVMPDEDVLLLRIRRNGKDFGEDSREYIPDGVIANTVDVYNNGTEEEYNNKIYEIVTNFTGD